MRLRYTGFPVAELRRSLRFYTRVFGLREVDRGDATEAGLGKWILLEDPRTHQGLELYEDPAGRKSARPGIPRAGLRHLGFLLERADRAELDRELRRVVRSGARATRVTPEATDGWVGWVRDPDDNWIEISRTPPRAARGRTRRRRRGGRRASR
jgi:catechol 2,3-dioxygenase-like lactoylglutathione lyase family enzyme